MTANQWSVIMFRCWIVQHRAWTYEYGANNCISCPSLRCTANVAIIPILPAATTRSWIRVHPVAVASSLPFLCPSGMLTSPDVWEFWSRALVLPLCSSDTFDLHVFTLDSPSTDLLQFFLKLLDLLSLVWLQFFLLQFHPAPICQLVDESCH